MGKSLIGKYIILGASRKTEEMSTLIEKQGATVNVYPLQGTVYKAVEEIKQDLLHFIENGADWSIITTGIGFETLVEVADTLGVTNEFIKQMRRTKVAVRGYKSKAILKKYGISFEAADDDGTTKGLIRQLKDVDFKNNKVVIQLHGEKAPFLTEFLKSKGAFVSHLLPYQHTQPEEEVVTSVCTEILSGKVDAICFTTAIQVRSLFYFAREKGIIEKIRQVLMDKTVAVAVGKVTAEALKEEGIERVIVPNHERMGAMIVELAKHYDA